MNERKHSDVWMRAASVILDLVIERCTALQKMWGVANQADLNRSSDDIAIGKVTMTA